MDIEMDADGLLRIRAARLGTQELDQLIHQLAEVRTTMEPEVPRRQEEAVDAVTFTVQDEPEAYVTRDADGRVSLGMRHAGFGWIAFAFTDNSAQRHLAAARRDAERHADGPAAGQPARLTISRAQPSSGARNRPSALGTPPRAPGVTPP